MRNTDAGNGHCWKVVGKASTGLETEEFMGSEERERAARGKETGAGRVVGISRWLRQSYAGANRQRGARNDLLRRRGVQPRNRAERRNPWRGWPLAWEIERRAHVPRGGTRRRDRPIASADQLPGRGQQPCASD